MLQKIASTINLLISTSLFILLLQGCASTPAHEDEASNLKKVYSYPYEQVWRAAQLSVARYPIQINNIETGILETDDIKGDLMWLSPGKLKSSNQGRIYKITLQVYKGKSSDKTSGTLVTINKQISLQRDFFSEKEFEKSDTLEEYSILYRIERELVIEKAVKRSMDTSIN